MSAGKKTDNHNPAAKLALRRHFLRRYHCHAPRSTLHAPLRVLDCCQGSMKLWSVLRSEFQPAEYFGVDLKPKAGRLKLDSLRLLARPGWTWNVIDVDTYGSPWKHWLEIMRHAPAAPLTVFLTAGMVKIGGGNCDRQLAEFFGLRFREMKVPGSVAVRALEPIADSILSAPFANGLRPVEILEAFPSKTARYLGLHLAPAA